MAGRGTTIEMDGVTMFWKDWCKHFADSQVTVEQSKNPQAVTKGLSAGASPLQLNQNAIQTVGRKPFPARDITSSRPQPFTAIRQRLNTVCAVLGWRCVDFTKKSNIKAWYLFRLDVGLLTDKETAESFCHHAWPELDTTVRKRYQALQEELKKRQGKSPR